MLCQVWTTTVIYTIQRSLSQLLYSILQFLYLTHHSVYPGWHAWQRKGGTPHDKVKLNSWELRKVSNRASDENNSIAYRCSIDGVDSLDCSWVETYRLRDVTEYLLKRLSRAFVKNNSDRASRTTRVTENIHQPRTHKRQIRRFDRRLRVPRHQSQVSTSGAVCDARKHDAICWSTSAAFSQLVRLKIIITVQC